MKSRVGAVALYAVSRVMDAKYSKWPFSVPRRTKTPQPIKAKFCGTDYVARAINFIMLSIEVALPIWVKLSTGGVYSGGLFGKRTADPERSSPIYYALIDAVTTKNVPFGVSTIHLIQWGSHLP
jgi:hypothetical protein